MKVKQSPGLLCKVALGLSGLRGSSDCQGAKFAQSLINLLFSTHPNSAHALTSPLQKLGAAPEQTGGAQSDIQRVPEIPHPSWCSCRHTRAGENIDLQGFPKAPYLNFCERSLTICTILPSVMRSKGDFPR